MPAASRRPPVSAVELDRRAYRRQQNTRSVLVSLISTIVFAVVVWLTVINTPGWSRVQQSFFDIETAIEAWPRVIAGLWVNVQVLFFAVIGVLVLSVLIATVRTLRGPVWFPLRALAAAYTDLFRGIPLIIVLFLVGFGLPGLELFPRNSAQFWGTIALILTYSAYVSEVFRAGIEAVHPSQRLAARSLGLNHGQTMRIVVLP
ncbi:MAG TPA: ABC transporter permease subunit, partial [Microcella sp.]|nr:ABC transporter permease subunit [Microcella sp.]